MPILTPDHSRRSTLTPQP